jgi:hypothetical protein
MAVVYNSFEEAELGFVRQHRHCLKCGDLIVGGARFCEKCIEELLSYARDNRELPQDTSK